MGSPAVAVPVGPVSGIGANSRNVIVRVGGNGMTVNSTDPVPINGTATIVPPPFQYTLPYGNVTYYIRGYFRIFLTGTGVVPRIWPVTTNGLFNFSLVWTQYSSGSSASGSSLITLGNSAQISWWEPPITTSTPSFTGTALAANLINIIAFEGFAQTADYSLNPPSTLSFMGAVNAAGTSFIVNGPSFMAISFDSGGQV